MAATVLSLTGCDRYAEDRRRDTTPPVVNRPATPTGDMDADVNRPTEVNRPAGTIGGGQNADIQAFRTRLDAGESRLETLRGRITAASGENADKLGIDLQLVERQFQTARNEMDELNNAAGTTDTANLDRMLDNIESEIQRLEGELDRMPPGDETNTDTDAEVTP
jgi:hypothetical protein